MSSEKNQCCKEQECCGSAASNASVWGAALLVAAVAVASALFVDYNAQQRLYVPYGTQESAKNAFALQTIQYAALSEQISKDPTFFDKMREQVKQQAAQQAGQQAAAPQGEDAPSVKKAADAQAKDLKADFYLDGEPGARFTIFEFSDLECPFCKRQEDQGVVAAVKARLPGEVNRVFKVNPLPFHQLARPAATAVLCAGEIGGAEAYYKGISAIFAAANPNDGSFAASVPSGLGKALKLDAKKFDACYKSDKFKGAIDAAVAQGAALGVTGTPGNVIFDNQTNNYVLVSGAYPAEAFVAAIDMLKAAK